METRLNQFLAKHFMWNLLSVTFPFMISRLASVSPAVLRIPRKQPYRSYVLTLCRHVKGNIAF